MLFESKRNRVQKLDSRKSTSVGASYTVPTGGGYFGDAKHEDQTTGELVRAKKQATDTLQRFSKERRLLSIFYQQLGRNLIGDPTSMFEVRKAVRAVSPVKLVVDHAKLDAGRIRALLCEVRKQAIAERDAPRGLDS